MINYGLKLWSSNLELFPAVHSEYARRSFNFIEIYNDASRPLDFKSLELLRGVPATVHATHSHGFHEFILIAEQLRIWNDVVALADFFSARKIVVHPGRRHTMKSFKENLGKIDDPRIIIENMAALRNEEYPVFACSISDLKKLRKVKPVCFDFEKAVKAALYLGCPYKDYIIEAVEALHPNYFHMSGGNPRSVIDEHLDLEGCGMDFAWIKRLLESLSEDVDLVFETPKRNGIENDLRNMQYFRSL